MEKSKKQKLLRSLSGWFAAFLMLCVFTQVMPFTAYAAFSGNASVSNSNPQAREAITYTIGVNGIEPGNTLDTQLQYSVDGGNSWEFIMDFMLQNGGFEPVLVTDTSPPFSLPTDGYYILRLYHDGKELGAAENNLFSRVNVTVGIPPDPELPPGPEREAASDAGTESYYQRHYDYWITVYTSLSELEDAGTLTVDTSGHDLDHIQHFVFDKLAGTNRTLVVNHKGEAYRINGRQVPESMLGHNQLFYGNLNGYMI